MKYLAIDYGLKRTGLAVCDPSQTICSPLSVLDSTRNLIGKLAEIITAENIDAVVVGLPINMDDTEGLQAKKVRDFAAKLKAAINVPLHFQDERLSSFTADEKLKMHDLSRAGKKQRQDALAAAQILQDFLDAQNR
ncbi:MAG: Holliday junction resolvase RuvX [Phycisphaerae bacterium]|jgi:putative Holliday junction resolvase